MLWLASAGVFMASAIGGSKRTQFNSNNTAPQDEQPEGACSRDMMTHDDIAVHTKATRLIEAR